MKKLILLMVLPFMVIMAGCNKGDSVLDSDITDGTSYDNEETIDEADGNNDESHDEDSDYTWNSADVNEIVFNGTTITENCDGASVSGTTLTISAAGNYQMTGTLTNGQVIVEAGDDDLVRLILNGVDITCSNSAPIYIKDAKKVIIAVLESTVNTLIDGSTYVYDDTEDEEPNSTIFSKTDLTVFGDGELNITANFNDAINCKDGLILATNNLAITAVDDGIRGKDYLIIKEGTITVDAGDDGLKSDNDEDATRGYIKVITCDLTISAKGDAILAYTDVLIEDGNFDLTTTGYVSSTNGVSSKAIKAGVNIIIDQGDFNIITTEDAIHSDETITIYAGNYTIEADDDGIHADADLVIENATINIISSLEGIEGGYITVNDGIIIVNATDDGFNATQGTEAMNDDGSQLIINGGTITVNMSGSDVDAMDSNGDITINGGTVNLNYPKNGPSEALDANGTITIGSGATVYENGEPYTGSNGGPGRP